MQPNDVQSIKFTPVVNPQELLEHADPTLFELYRNGAELHQGQSGSSHQWWLSMPGNKDEVVQRWASGTCPSEAFFVFAGVEAAADQPEASGVVRRSGSKPARDTWVYDDKIYQACVERWNTAVACAKEFNDLAGSRHINLDGLREFSLQLARSLKRGNACPMLADNVPVYEDLCAMGLAAVTPHGYITATEQLKQLRVPNATTLTKSNSAH